MFFFYKYRIYFHLMVWKLSYFTCGYRRSWNIYFHTTRWNKSCIYRKHLNILYIFIIYLINSFQVSNNKNTAIRINLSVSCRISFPHSYHALQSVYSRTCAWRCIHGSNITHREYYIWIMFVYCQNHRLMLYM